MLKVFYISSEKKNHFGVNQVLLSLKKFLNKSVPVYDTGNLNKFMNCKYDLIHIHGCWKIKLFIYFVIAKLRNMKIVVSPHGMLDPYSLKQKIISKFFFWHIIQKYIFILSDQIIVNSNIEKKNICRLINFKKITVIPHGIELETSNFKKKIKSLKFVFFSRIHPSKNLLTLINLWTNNKYFQNLELSIYGEISDYKYFEMIQKKILKFKNINYRKPLYKNKIKILSNYDIFVFPSMSENFGLVIIEALAAGLYLILNRNLPWHHLKKKKYASLINFNNNQLISTIDNIKKKINKINQNSYQKSTKLYLKENYNWKKIISVYVKIYKKLM